MKLIIIIFISSFSLVALGQSPKLVWANTIGGIEIDKSWLVHIDKNGNIITVGRFSDIVDFDPGPNENLISSIGEEDLFIQKSDPNGNFMWVKTIGGSGTSYCSSLVEDTDGNLYLSGDFKESIDFDPGMGEFNLTSISHQDIFILKLTNEGSFIWAKSIGGSNATDQAYGSVLDLDNNLILTGLYTGVADFDPGPDIYNLTDSPGFNSFVLKLNAEGNFIWAKSFGNGSSFAQAIAIDSESNLYISGVFSDTINYLVNNENQQFVSKGDLDLFLLKTNPEGEIEFVKSIGGNKTDFAKGIEIDANHNIIFTGYFEGIIDLNPNSGIELSTEAELFDSFIIKLDENGNYFWSKQIGSEFQDFAKSLVLDPQGNIIVGGSFQSTVNFGTDSQINKLTSNGPSDIFILKLDIEGDLVWLSQFGGSGSDCLEALTLDDNLNIVATGDFQKTISFESNSGIESHVSNGKTDIFTFTLGDSILTSNNNYLTKNINVYPNPTTGLIEIDAPFNMDISTSLFSLSGQLIKSVRERKLSFSNSKNGIYILEIKDLNTGMTIHKKIFKTEM